MPNNNTFSPLGLEGSPGMAQLSGKFLNPQGQLRLRQLEEYRKLCKELRIKPNSQARCACLYGSQNTKTKSRLALALTGFRVPPPE